MSALKLVRGRGTDPVKVGFGIHRKSRKGVALPAGVYLVATSRPAKPYVLDLLLYVNPEPKP